MRVASQDPRVRELVGLIAKTVEAGGGYVHPELTVNHAGPSLWLTLPRAANPYADAPALDRPAPDAPALLVVPDDLHVPVTDLDWVDDADTLQYSDSTAHLSDSQRVVLDAMVDLFNACGKVAHVPDTYPALGIADDPEVLSLVREARPRWNGLPASSPSQWVLNARLRGPSSGDDEEGHIGFLMPMIDMLNHHPYGSRFERAASGDWVVRVHHPTDTDQVFIRYNKADALGVALGLGYFEPATRFVSSVACEFELPRVGSVRIAGVGGQRRRLPAPSVKREVDGITIAGLQLEPAKKETVVSLLELPLRSLIGDGGSSRLLAHELLAQVVAANRNYYRRLLALTEAPANGGSRTDLHALLAQVSRHQLRLLSR